MIAMHFESKPIVQRFGRLFVSSKWLVNEPLLYVSFVHFPTFDRPIGLGLIESFDRHSARFGVIPNESLRIWRIIGVVPCI
jgi:hypothetical protein